MLKTCQRLILITTSLVLFFSVIAKASPYTEVQPQSFDVFYKKLVEEFQSLDQELPTRLKIRKHNDQNTRRPLKARQAEKLARYLELKKNIATYKPVFELKEKLNDMYVKGAQTTIDQIALNLESTRLALGVIEEIGRLRHKYKSFFIPIFHNMMIDVGIKKRGACKHWAEDLLDYMKTVKRDFFFITWGEANPRKITEHNVAVVYPNYGGFNDGLLIDPWRTSGKPFWIHVTEDPHYKWHKWDGYPIY